MTKLVYKHHKASFLIEKFLDSVDLKTIDVYDIAILTRCAKLMDYNYRKENKKVLYGYQETIATKCCVTRTFLNRRFKSYIKREIFKQLTFHRGRSNNFALGPLVDPSACEALEMSSHSEKDISSACEAQASACEAQASACEAHYINIKSLTNTKALQHNKPVVFFAAPDNQNQKLKNQKAIKSITNNLYGKMKREV